MATTRLTRAGVRVLRPRKTVRNLRDAELRELGVRLYPTGRKRFFIHSQYNDRTIRAH